MAKNKSKRTPNLVRGSFEFHRNAVLRHIDLLRSAIDENAIDLELVAAEGVFEKSISDELKRTSRALYPIAQQLDALRNRVASAGYPKAGKKRF